MRNALSQRFSRAVNTYEEWAKPQRESARLLVSFLKPYGFVLDLGCGTGFVSEELEGATPLGLDLSPEMVKAYKAKFGKGVVGRAEELPFKDKSFDFVLSNFSLHWGDWEKAVREALRVAKRAVGLAVPVEGSKTFSSFPFPKAESILSLFPGEYFVKLLPIPYEGMELVKFFHYTGTTLYEGKKTLSPAGLKEALKEMKGAYFKVLYLKIEP